MHLLSQRQALGVFANLSHASQCSWLHQHQILTKIETHAGARPTEKLAASIAVGLINRKTGRPSAVALNSPNDWKWVNNIRNGQELNQQRWVKASVADIVAYAVFTGELFQSPPVSLALRRSADCLRHSTNPVPVILKALSAKRRFAFNQGVWSLMLNFCCSKHSRPCLCYAGYWLLSSALLSDCRCRHQHNPLFPFRDLVTGKCSHSGRLGDSHSHATRVQSKVCQHGRCPDSPRRTVQPTDH